MPLGGYLSGSITARNTAKMSRHNQGGGPKKAGLAPKSAWMRQGMSNLKYVKDCSSRATTTICHSGCNITSINPTTGKTTYKKVIFDPITGKKKEIVCNIPTTSRPATSGGVGTKNTPRTRCCQ